MFNLAGYHSLLNGVLDAGYKVGQIAGQPEAEGRVYLRHDIDFDIHAARVIAELEAEMGVFSHFYFLTTTPFYNLFDPEVSDILRAISAAGHKVGLHCDPTAAGGRTLSEQLAHESRLIEMSSGAPCESFSFHRPPQNVLASEDVVDGMTSCYGQSWFKGIKYCSDSTGRWRYGRPDETQAWKTGGSIQLLTHPIWWYLDDEESPAERLGRFHADRSRTCREDIAANSTIQLPQTRVSA